MQRTVFFLLEKHHLFTITFPSFEWASLLFLFLPSKQRNETLIVPMSMSDSTYTSLAFLWCLPLLSTLRCAGPFKTSFPSHFRLLTEQSSQFIHFVSFMPRRNEANYVQVRRNLYQSSFLQSLSAYSMRRCSFKEATLLSHDISILWSNIFHLSLSLHVVTIQGDRISKTAPPSA
jgi:hypothetical protein